MESISGATTRKPFSSNPDLPLEKSTLLSKRLRPTRLGAGLLSSKCQRVSVRSHSAAGDDDSDSETIQRKQQEKDDENETVTFKPISSSVRSTRNSSRGTSSSVNEFLQTVAEVDDDIVFSKDKPKSKVVRQKAKASPSEDIQSDEEASNTMTQNIEATVKIPAAAAVARGPSSTRASRTTSTTKSLSSTSAAAVAAAVAVAVATVELSTPGATGIGSNSKLVEFPPKDLPPPVKAAAANKPNLKRYIDDKLKSFDPNSRGRPRSSSDANSKAEPNAQSIVFTTGTAASRASTAAAAVNVSTESQPSSGDDTATDDDNQETCKLDSASAAADLSICETKVIPKDVAIASVRNRRSSRSTAASSSTAAASSVAQKAATITSENSTTRRDSGSSSASNVSCESSFEDPTTAAAAAGGGCGGDGDVDMGKKKKKKRVSFAHSDEIGGGLQQDGGLLSLSRQPTKGSQQQQQGQQQGQDLSDEIVEMGKKKTKSRSASSKSSSSLASGYSNTNAVTATLSSNPVFQDSDRHVILNGRTYVKLGVLGKGGSSCVHRVLSLADGQLYAYKRVDVRGSGEDSDAVFDSYVNEIDLLKRLKGSPYIIELVEAEVNREDMYIAMVMEAGEVDLSKVLTQKQKLSVAHLTAGGTNASVSVSGAAVSASSTSTSGKSADTGNEGTVELLNPFFARLIWQEMLAAVDHIHQHRIVHGDLKPANFVFVKGHLKLIDFGIAKAFSNDTTNIYRESQIGTINYMAPEAIAPFSIEHDDKETHLKMKLGRASDIWSLGCILYQMVYGRPPFAALNTIQKLHAIPNPKYEIQYPSAGSGHAVDADAIDTIKACLVRDPRVRAAITGDRGLLDLPYLTLTGRQSSSSSSSTQYLAIVPAPKPVVVCCDASTQSDKSEEEGSKDGDADKSVGDVSFLAPIIPITEVRKAVDIVAAALSERRTVSAAESESVKDEISRRVWRMLNREEEEEVEEEDKGEGDPRKGRGVLSRSSVPHSSLSCSVSTTTAVVAGGQSAAASRPPRIDLSAVCAELQKKQMTASSKRKGGGSVSVSPSTATATTTTSRRTTDTSSSGKENVAGYSSSKSYSSSANASTGTTAPATATATAAVSRPGGGGKGGGGGSGSGGTVSFASAVADAAKKIQARRDNNNHNDHQSNLIPTPNRTTDTGTAAAVPGSGSLSVRDRASAITTLAAAAAAAKVTSVVDGGVSAGGKRTPLTTLPLGFAEQIRQQQQLLLKNKLNTSAGTAPSQSNSASAALEKGLTGGQQEQQENSNIVDRGARWMKPRGESPEKQDLQSVLEKRLGEMRKFFDNEPDATGTADFTDGLSFF